MTAVVSVRPLVLTMLCSQPDARTIEGVLFDALVRVGAVSSDNADDPTKVNLGRAARTDAGVHAAGNLVSLKLITQIPGVPDVVAAINNLLPPEIRVWGIVRVQNSFNARTYALPFSKMYDRPHTEYRSCDSRKYTYFFPSYLLIPPKPGSGMYETFRRHVAPLSNSLPNAGAFTNHIHPFWAESPPESSKDDELQRKRRWRAGPEEVQRLRETAKKFEGTRNFHNFTLGREFSDRSTQRHMKKIEVGHLLKGLVGTNRMGVRYPTQLSMAAQSGSVLCFMVRASCFIRYLAVLRRRFSTYPLDRSCVCTAKRVAYTLIELCPTA
jgi:tRNA pseudouridine38-40 synthase